VSRDDEAFMPPELVARVLVQATPDVVLIGGQALAYWMDYYRIEDPDAAVRAVSRDVDFFTRDASNHLPLHGFARAIGGIAKLRDKQAPTAHIGSAVAPAPEEGRVYNVDLLHDVVGLDRKKVESNAVEVMLPGIAHPLRVMHPLDLLQSRNANLHGLPDKQDETGQRQLRLAIRVVRAHLEAIIDGLEAAPAPNERTRQRAVFDAIKPVIDYSGEDAAKKNAKHFGIHLAEAIPVWRIRSEEFWSKQWPHLRQRMSVEYADYCEASIQR